MSTLSHCLKFAIVAFMLSLVSCGSSLTLLPKSAAVPGGIDLSGSWIARERPATVMGSGVHSNEGIVIASKRSKRPRLGSDVSEVSPGHNSNVESVQVFLELGQSLKITQTEFGLFIGYDRSVVEEYTFGENRLVSIGPIRAQRVSGWDEGAFAVQTLDESGASLLESWRLQENGSVLVRDIQIVKNTRQRFFLRRVYDRD